MKLQSIFGVIGNIKGKGHCARVLLFLFLPLLFLFPGPFSIFYSIHLFLLPLHLLFHVLSLSLSPLPPLPYFLLHFLFHSLIPLASSSPFHTLFSFPSPPFPFMPPFLSFDASYFLLYFLLHSFVPLTSSPPFSRSFLFTFPFKRVTRIFICFSNSLFSRSCPPLYPLPIAPLLLRFTLPRKLKRKNKK